MTNNQLGRIALRLEIILACTICHHEIIQPLQHTNGEFLPFKTSCWRCGETWQVTITPVEGDIPALADFMRFTSEVSVLAKRAEQAARVLRVRAAKLPPT